MKFLQGKKTYLVAAGMLAYAILGYLLYGTPINVQNVLNALGLAALRAGVANGTK